MELTEPQTEDAARRKRRHRHVLWVLAVIVVLLLLAITPPLINVSRFHHRIVASISQSLGRPVYLDHVTLHLLPMPGFTLENLVVSEDPAFGNEPIIRANTVEATLRVSSLWRRRVEFSTVTFVDPSVNLVRNAQGHWNLESVLVHASHVDTAPTSQRKAGPAPRFPYIEATGGRINIKLGEQKMPFSLTDANFALWLPSPQVWRVRLQGTPARTDENLDQPGTLRLDGSLERAAHMEEVPVDLHASWHDVPMGDASRLITGEDLDWRGTLHADASLRGPLGAASLKTQFTLDDLRRADFIPAQSLDVSVRCISTADVPTATLTGLACSVPTSGKQQLQLQSPSVDLTHPAQSAATIRAEKLPLNWLFGWMRLFSPRIPTQSPVPGAIDAALAHAQDSPAAQWSGTASLTIPATEYRANGRVLPAKSGAKAAMQSFMGTVTPVTGGWNFAMPPTPLRLGPGADLTLSAEASAAGYGFTVNGEASPAQLANIARELPQLSDDSGLLVPARPATGADTIRKIELTCSRSWTPGQASGQTCAVPSPPRRRKVVRSRRRQRR